MHFSRSLSLLLLAAASVARGQVVPATPVAPHDKTLNLDAVVVSAGPDGKTAFDLAQGTSVLSGDELRRRAQDTLGETLSATPGVSGTAYGPGASRPIIRGLGGDRIRILENGVGSLDVANVSPDHNTAIEPLFAQSVEVLRGPATLLYGSSAVGGAVNVIDNDIPIAPGDGQVHGTVEGRFLGAGNERTGVASVNAGSNAWAVQVNALKRKTKDIDIPGVARIDDDAPANQPRGTLPNSAIDTRSGSIGATAFGSTGHVGVSIMRYETVYGVPGDEAVSIDMKQTRVDLSGELTQPFGIFRSAKGRAGFSQYHHSEIGDGEVHTTFRSRAGEARLELPHVQFGPMTGTVGAQVTRTDLSTIGEEVVTPPSVTETGALFALEEIKHDRLTYQFGGRVEAQTVKLGDVEPGLPSVQGYAARSGEKKRFVGLSGSIGAVYYAQKDTSVALALAYSERLPTAQELFSNGPHGGTGAYDVGTTGLGNERSVGADLSVRRRAGAVTGSVGVFVNRFNDYVFEENLPATAIPAGNNPDGLTPFQYVARDALFWGAEAEAIIHLVDEKDRHVHLSLNADSVRATETTRHVALPRIPPQRVGAALRFDNAHWDLGVDVQHAAAQTHVAPDETTTPQYTLVGADVNYLLTVNRVTYTLFAKGQNLTDREARPHTSFLKEFAPLAGRGVTFGVRATF
jgi:iron complex outermembrane receptor protein